MRLIINFQNIHIEIPTNQSFRIFQIQIAQNRLKFLPESRYICIIIVISWWFI